jgi:hypothetical protein
MKIKSFLSLSLFGIKIIFKICLGVLFNDYKFTKTTFY